MFNSFKLISLVLCSFFLGACSQMQQTLSCPYASKTYYENGEAKEYNSLSSQHILIDFSKATIFVSKYGRTMKKYSFDQIGQKIYFEDNTCYFFGGCSDEVTHKMKGEYDMVSKEIKENILSTWGHMQKTHLLEGKCSAISPKEFGRFGETEFTSTR